MFPQESKDYTVALLLYIMHMYPAIPSQLLLQTVSYRFIILTCFLCTLYIFHYQLVKACPYLCH